MNKTIKITFNESVSPETAQTLINSLYRLLDNNFVKNYEPVESHFDLIREWARDKGILEHGDMRTQSLKLAEEAGEVAAAALRNNKMNLIDGIGDCVIVLTSLAHHAGVTIENCIEAAYEEIKARQGKMVGGDFQKNA